VEVTLTGEVGMIWLLLCTLPVTLFWLLDMLCGARPPRLVRLLWRGVERAASRLSPVRFVPRRRQVVDVFDTLRLQSRLGAVADEILRLESDRRVFAKAARLRATHRAYDDLLAEACRLAQVRPADGGDPEAGRYSGPGVVHGGVDDARAHAELELAARGWSW
jgi:hypothetical protein